MRTLETMIRLSTAHAKARLSDSVETYDVESVTELLEESVFCRTLTKTHMEEEIDDDLDEVDQQLRDMVMRETQNRNTQSNMTSPLLSQKRKSRATEKQNTATSEVKKKNNKTRKADKVDQDLQQVQSMFQTNMKSEEMLKQMKKKMLELVGEM